MRIKLNTDLKYYFYLNMALMTHLLVKVQALTKTNAIVCFDLGFGLVYKVRKTSCGQLF